TRSMASAFWRTALESSRRKRGRIAALAAWRSMSASFWISIVTAQSQKVENLGVEHVARANIAEGADHDVLAARHAAFDVIEHGLHRIALKAILGAAEVAGDNREGHGVGELREVRFG